MSLLMIIAAAAAPAAAEAVATPAPPQRGVIAYPASFFADAAPTSAYDMVIRLPGFSFDKGQVVRGLAGSGGNVLIDGQPPVSKNDALDEALKRIPAAAVERVELIRGGAPGIDMEGRTVLANVVRKSAAGFRGAMQFGDYFVLDGRTLPGGRMEGQWRWPGGRSAELSQIYGSGPNDEYGDGQRVRYAASGAVLLRSDVDADAGGTKIWTTGAYETPLAGGRARITGAFMLSPASVELYDRYVGGGREYEYDRIERLQAELGGRYSRSLTQRLSMEGVAFQQWNNNKTTVHFEAPNLTRDFLLDRKSTETVGRLHLKFRQTAQMFIETGAEAALNKLDSVTALTVNGAAIRVPAANVQVKETRGEVFARGAWRASPRTTLEAGIRHEASRLTSEGDVVLEKSLTFTKPRAALTWDPSPFDQVRLRVEREVGQLNFDDFVASPNVASTGTVVSGNPDITPQQAWVIEAAYERRFWTSGAAILTMRHHEIDDVVDRVPIFSAAGVLLADAPGNIGKGTKDEVSASLTVPLDRFHIPAAQLKGLATWRRSQVTDPVTRRSRHISGLHPIDWEGHFSQDLPHLKTTWGIDAIGGFRERFFRLTEVETRKFSTSVWVFIEVKPRPTWILRTELQGVTFRNSRRIREVYTGPRNTSGLSYTDVRDLEWGGAVYMRVRKTFG
jgi:outer membrane receptor protein involved in Fe transport